MNDARARALARAATQGDEEARVALGAQMVREGRCPECGGPTWEYEGAGLTWDACLACPWESEDRRGNDGQSKEDV